MTIKTIGLRRMKIIFFSRDEDTLSEDVSVRRSVRMSVMLSLIGLLGATFGRVSGLISMIRI